MNGYGIGALKMGSFKFLKLVTYVAVLWIGGALDSFNSLVIIHFHEAPPQYSMLSTAVFRFTIHNLDGTNACQDNNNGCSISCKLDNRTQRSCPADAIILKNLTVNQKHSFLLNVTTHTGETNSSSYSWYIDQVPPTARISSEQNITNAESMTVDITFTEACHGFQCVNSSECDVIVDGPAYVLTSSLRTIKPDMKYRVDIIFSSTTSYGRVVIRMADSFCTDKAGNSFVRANDSIKIVHFDRRPVVVDLWMPVPSYVLEINGVVRTVLASNKMADLKIFLDFSAPVKNSTEEVLSALRVTSGIVLPVLNGNHGNRKFAFEIKNVSSTEIITVELEADLVVGWTGNPVSPIPSLAVLYDSSKPAVGLSTSSPSVTKASTIDVVAEFSKPVFSFEASMVEVEGGKLTRFKEISRALYSFTVVAVTSNTVSINIPEGKVNDISGNPNVASNQLKVKHYSTPAISTALHSFVTAGVLATSLTAAALSVSCANLEAIGAIASGNVASNPSMNLHGLFGHLQVFVLSDWLSTNHPIEYSETTKGLRWLLPRQKLPWKKDSSSIWPNHIHLDEANLISLQFLNYNYNHIDNLTSPTNVSQLLLSPSEMEAKSLQGHNISMESAQYGQPLNAREYFSHFLRGEPLSASNAMKKMENYDGWLDLEMNLFWLAIGGGSLVVIHVVILVFLRWRTGTAAHGILSVPRFELLLLILMLPCISQSSAFVIRGGTRWGIVTGVLLLIIPAAFILSIYVFLIIGIFSGSFAQYKEIRHIDIREKWYEKLWRFFVGRPVTGKWLYREGLPSSFLPRFGILFDNRKGPPLYVFTVENEPNLVPKWSESSQGGIGRMRAVSLEDSNEETKMPMSRRLLGCARSSYIIIDLLRRVSFSIISGAFSSQSSDRTFFALAITVIQFFYLFTLRPYIRRGVHLVECISLLCEVGIFGLSIATHTLHSSEDRTLGYIMLALLFVTFIAQVTNEWYALIKCLLMLSPRKNSFRLGLTFAAKSLVLPFFPRKNWSRIINTHTKPKTGLSPVPPLSPEMELERRYTRVDSFGATTATVVPVLSPDLPGGNVTGMTSSIVAGTSHAGHRAGEGKSSKGLKLERKSELQKLRELAKASFSGNPTDDDNGHT